ncbi:MAG TPA: PIG-L family deacetylase [Candidatus Limnocylindrales bacterium]|nr:PIG-L family deacetylase [Candidatus Limnocylindrales bacterium]
MQRPDPASARSDLPGLLLVHAHPDDESFATAGLIARAVAEGHRVDLVTCTGGEEGEIHDPSLDYDEAFPRLSEIRRRELDCSLDALRGIYPGELDLHLLGYRDSGMMGTPSNDRPEAFWQADLDEATRRLVEIVRRVRPAVIVTYDPNGNYGHPDHINAHRIAAAAWEAAADPDRYPDAGEPHAVAKFYEIAFNRDRWFSLMRDMTERGIPLPWDFGTDDLAAASPEPASEGRAADELYPANVDAVRQVEERLASGEEVEGFGMPEAQITTIVDVAAYARAKRASMDCHKTQRQDMGWLLDLPDDLAAKAISPEHFVLTRWRDREVPAGLRESWLFEGL